MDPARERSPNIVVEATLGAFQDDLKRVLVPLMLYKALYLGDWYRGIAGQERDRDVRQALVNIGLDTLRETIELLKVMHQWDQTPRASDLDELGDTMHRRALHDLTLLKMSSNEAVLYAAMRAPTADIRDALVKLADDDRVHANTLRRLLTAAEVPDRARVDTRQAPGRATGAHEGRDPDTNLGASIQATLERIREGRTTPLRLVASPETLRHLRDEGLVTPEGTVFELPVDVDFGWRGECYAILTDENVRLSEILTSQDGPH